MASPPSFLEACRPPWVVFPELDPRELAGHQRQGVGEVYFVEHWGPFWSSLDAEQRALYLEHWRAAPAWRAAIAFHCDDDPNLDAEADVRESEELLAQQRQERAARAADAPWWKRLLRPRR